MDGESILDRLHAAGVIAVEGDRVSTTERFDRRRAEIASGAGEPTRPSWLTDDLVEGSESGDAIAAIVAIDEFAEDLDHREVVAAASALERVEDPPTATGAPDGFVPLYQEDLVPFLRQHEASVIFVWKEDSPSCAAMAETLGELQGDPLVDETVGLGSICVGDGAGLLREQYDVGVLPTTLFFVGERVDSRFWAPRGFESVRREVAIVTGAEAPREG